MIFLLFPFLYCYELLSCSLKDGVRVWGFSQQIERRRKRAVVVEVEGTRQQRKKREGVFRLFIDATRCCALSHSFFRLLASFRKLG